MALPMCGLPSTLKRHLTDVCAVKHILICSVVIAVSLINHYLPVNVQLNYRRQ